MEPFAASSSQESVILSSFMEITNCERPRALEITKAATDNLERAIEIYYSQLNEEKEAKKVKDNELDNSVIDVSNDTNDLNLETLVASSTQTSSQEPDILSRFMEITKCKRPRALEIIRAATDNLERAFEIYFNQLGEENEVTDTNEPNLDKVERQKEAYLLERRPVVKKQKINNIANYRQIPQFDPYTPPNFNFGFPNWNGGEIFRFGVNSVPETSRLRPIVIDGCNVAMQHGLHKVFSVKGIQIIINYFQTRGHEKILTFVPQSKNKGQDAAVLQKLEREGRLVFTPSRHIGGKTITCYDDRFILDYAVSHSGVIVSRDNFRDLVQEKAAYREVVAQRLLMPTFVGDEVMMPQDPLGRHGPSLDIFLRLPN